MERNCMSPTIITELFEWVNFVIILNSDGVPCPPAGGEDSLQHNQQAVHYSSPEGRQRQLHMRSPVRSGGLSACSRSWWWAQFMGRCS